MHVWTSSLLSFLGAWNDASARNVAAELGLRRRLGRPRRGTGRHLPTGRAVTCAALQRGTRQSRPSARPGAAAGVGGGGNIGSDAPQLPSSATAPPRMAGSKLNVSPL